MEIERTITREREGNPSDPADNGAAITDALTRARAMSAAADNILDRAFQHIDVDALLQRQGGGQ